MVFKFIKVAWCMIGNNRCLKWNQSSNSDLVVRWWYYHLSGLAKSLVFNFLTGTSFLSCYIWVVRSVLIYMRPVLHFFDKRKQPTTNCRSQSMILTLALQRMSQNVTSQQACQIETQPDTPKAPQYLRRLDLSDGFSCVTKPLLTGQQIPATYHIYPYPGCFFEDCSVSPLQSFLYFHWSLSGASLIPSNPLITADPHPEPI